jgi:hypothetical protein
MPEVTGFSVLSRVIKEHPAELSFQRLAVEQDEFAANLWLYSIDVVTRDLCGFGLSHYGTPSPLKRAQEEKLCITFEGGCPSDLSI